MRQIGADFKGRTAAATSRKEGSVYACRFSGMKGKILSTAVAVFRDERVKQVCTNWLWKDKWMCCTTCGVLAEILSGPVVYWRRLVLPEMKPPRWEHVSCAKPRCLAVCLVRRQIFLHLVVVVVVVVMVVVSSFKLPDSFIAYTTAIFVDSEKRSLFIGSLWPSVY